MRELEEKIRKDGTVIGTDILKVNNFLNHQLDVELFQKMGAEWYRLFEKDNVNKILTIESSGIALATIAATYFHCPVVFAKKNRGSNLPEDVYFATVTSFTHQNTYQAIVSKDYLSPSDRILLIDDFLARGAALKGLISIVREAQATIVGAGIAIEKSFQPGRKSIEEEGIRIESLARIQSMNEKEITFLS